MSVDTDRVLDLAGDSGLGDGGRGAPQQEALAKHKVWELLQQVVWMRQWIDMEWEFITQDRLG